MAARLFSSRSRAVALTLTRNHNPSSTPIDTLASSHHCLRTLYSLASYPPPSMDRRMGESSGCGFPIPGPFGHSKFFAFQPYQAPYDHTSGLPIWSCAEGQIRGMKHKADNTHCSLSAVAEKINKVGGVGDNLDGSVTSFSPLEGAAISKQASALANESLKIKRTELSQRITFALIPALLLVSKNSLTTSLLISSVYWQIYGFFKEIFLDYVHHDVTRKWVFIYFQLLLLVLAKDTILHFNLV